jgi:hypothetical protein
MTTRQSGRTPAQRPKGKRPKPVPVGAPPRARLSAPVGDAERAHRLEHAADLFRSWREDEDEQDQKETWASLRRTLDEDRTSDRLLFP